MQAKNNCILVVDDEIELAELIAEMLGIYGYVTEMANSGNQAIEKIKRNPAINIVVSDITMPNGNGIELLDFINGLRTNIALFFITGYSNIDSKKLIDAGARGIFSKPLDYALLISEIEKASENGG